jgi:hypothetical protein
VAVNCRALRSHSLVVWDRAPVSSMDQTRCRAMLGAQREPLGNRRNPCVREAAHTGRVAGKFRAIDWAGVSRTHHTGQPIPGKSPRDGDVTTYIGVSRAAVSIASVGGTKAVASSAGCALTSSTVGVRTLKVGVPTTGFSPEGKSEQVSR